MSVEPQGKNIRIFLLCMRFFGIIIPQIGYIHPDEFFQGPEIAGETLDYEIYRAWEFNQTQPIRSIAFPLLIGYGSFLPLKHVADWAGVALPSYLLLAAPRFLMLCFSFVHNYHLSKMCSRLGLDVFPVSVIFGSSYVCFVFMIRTFSNCLEAVLFTVLLSIAVSTQVPNKKKDHGKSSSYDVAMIGAILSAGIFLRPTFLLFAVTPVLFWFFPKGFSFESKYVNKILKVGLSSALVAIAFISLDSVYFRWKHSESMNVVSNIVLTPLNFFLYNSKTSNLENHGLHPRYLHFLVNIPLMFNVLGIVALYKCFKYFTAIHKASRYESLLQLSWLIPTVGLSVFPHQEPRFLIPLLSPFVLLHAGTVYRNTHLKVLWVIGNMVCAIIFGSLHQGGLVPFLLESASIRSAVGGHTTIIFSHLYMQPRHLLQLQTGQQDVLVQDFGFDVPVETIPGMYCKETCLVVLPGTVAFSELTLNHWKAQGRRISLVKSYFPHLSMEHLPNFSKLWALAPWKDFNLFWKTCMSKLSLQVYSVTS